MKEEGHHRWITSLSRLYCNEAIVNHHQVAMLDMPLTVALRNVGETRSLMYILFPVKARESVSPMKRYIEYYPHL